jgi:hypothetical protein
MENMRSRRLSKHVIAMVCSTGFMTLVPTALYGALIVWSGDLGGPLNPVLIPAMSGVIGFIISLLIFLPLSLLTENSDFQRWWRIAGFVLSALAAVVILVWVFFGTIKLQTRAYLFVGIVATYIVSGFFVYLCGLAIGTRIWGKS